MPNTYFQFKQFTVHQEKAALKVSTDSCLFGAWVANKMQSEKLKADNILDIGAGAGLLMFMLAQKSDAVIDGIEIDEASFLQADENINASKWIDRLKLIHADVKQFQFKKKYDFIISNPPFYQNDLRSEKQNRNIAMHDEGLKLDELLTIVKYNLTADGSFAVLLPSKRVDAFTVEAEKHRLFLLCRCDVKQSVNHSPFRSMLWFQKEPGENLREEICIKNEVNEYTTEFIQLLEDYYLNL